MDFVDLEWKFAQTVQFKIEFYQGKRTEYVLNYNSRVLDSKESRNMTTST